ncbi:MAG TPA: ATP-binding protein, partial [Acidobacteriota bacterium]|nr:ATP-binding protein [Acidobacteriota bacterium]
EVIAKALNGRAPRFEWMHRNAQGRDVLCEIRLVRLPAAGCNLIRGSLTDLTERSRTERALRENRALLEATLESTADGILVVDGSGKVIHTNRRFAELWRIPDALLQTRDDDKLLAFVLNQLVDPDAFRTKVRELYGSTREDLDTFAFKDGRLFERYSRPLMRGDDIAGRVWSFRDITERVRHQKELTRARRLETAGQLAGQIAHDFNNLLGPLAAYPEMARRHLPLDSEVHRMLDIIETCATQMAEINQQLLTLSRRGHYRAEPLDLNKVIDETLQSADMPETVIINTRLEPELFLCKGGKAQIQRVLVNLLNNAREAIDGVGSINIHTDNIYLDGPLTRHRRITKGEYIRVQITDNGSGIPPEVIDRIFDPFFTTKTADKHRGTGLGLSIVHSVIEDHEGYVDIESTPGRGTTVSLYFPICRDAVNQESTPSEVPRGAGQRVLVVDDDPIQRQVAQDALSELGYVVVTVVSGEEAVRMATDATYDILVLDMVMDGIDGVETLRRIRESRPDQAAVLLSGYATIERVEEAVDLGIKDMLAKPVRIPTLAIAIHRALRETTPAESPSG